MSLKDLMNSSDFKSEYDKIKQGDNSMINKTPVVKGNTSLNIDDSMRMLNNMGVLEVLADSTSASISNYGYQEKGFSTDPSRYQTEKNLQNSGFDDIKNSFYKGWLNTKLSSEFGKIAYDWQGISAEKTIDDYDKNKANLDTLLRTGKIDQATYGQRLNSLNADLSTAQKRMDEATAEISRLQEKIDGISTSKDYETRSYVANLKGDDAGLLETLQYSMPEQLGSSASLMAVNMGVAFGTRLAASAATSMITGATGGSVVPGLGTAIGAITGLFAAVGATLYARKEESYGEIGGAIMESRQKLAEKYVQDYNEKNPYNHITLDQIPEDVKKDIREQSRKGLDDLFYSNMWQSAGDIASALLLPGSKLLGVAKTALGGYKAVKALGKLGDKLDDVNSLMSQARNYNFFTRRAFDLGKMYARGKMEAFEEGSQYAYTQRYMNEALGLDEYQNKGFFSNLLQDSYDVIGSMNYGIENVISMRGNGRYRDDSEFQAATNGGALMGYLMGMPTGAFSTVKEELAFRKTNKDIINNGLLDMDSKMGRVKAEIYQNYFVNNSTDRLISSINALSRINNKETDQPFISTEDAINAVNEIKDMKRSYDLLSERVDDLPNRGFLSLWSKKEDRLIKDAYKKDLFTNILNLKRQNIDSSIMNSYINQELAEQNNLKGDVIYNNFDKLNAEKTALTQLISSIQKDKSTFVSPTQKEQALKYYKDRLNTLNNNISAEQSHWFDIGLNTKDRLPNSTLVNLYANVNTLNLYRQQNLDLNNELSKVVDYKSLNGFYENNKNRVDTYVQRELGLNDFKDLDKQDLQEDELEAEESTGTDPLEVDTTDTTTVETNTETPTTDNVESTELEDPLLSQRKELVRKLVSDEGDIVENVQDYLENIGISSTDNFVTTWNKLMEEPSLRNFWINNFTPLKDMLSEGKSEEEVNQIMGFTLDENGNIEGLVLEDITLDDLIPEIQGTPDKIREQNILLNRELSEAFDNKTGNELELNDQERGANKIVDSLSIAQKNIEYGAKGLKIEFSTQNDQQILNTNVVFNSNSSFRIKVIEDKSSNLSNVNTKYNDVDLRQTVYTESGLLEADKNMDTIKLGIYLNINGQERIVGYLHTIEGAVRLLANDTKESQENYIAQITKLRQIREKIILASKDNPSIKNDGFNINVTKRKFGKANLDGTYKTISSAIGGDKRPFLTFATDVDSLLNENNETVTTYKGLTKGGVYLMLPNELDGEEVMVPTWVLKNPLRLNSRIQNNVTDNIISWLSSSPTSKESSQSRNNISRYLFTTNKSLNLDLRGVNLIEGSIDEGRKIKLGEALFTVQQGNIFRLNGPQQTPVPSSREDLLNVVGSMYPDINKKVYTSEFKNEYLKELMSSGLFLTDIIQNKVLKDRYNNDSFYSDNLNEEQQYQYFSQHTMEFTVEGTANNSKIINWNTVDIKDSNSLAKQPKEITDAINNNEDINHPLVGRFMSKMNTVIKDVKDNKFEIPDNTIIRYNNTLYIRNSSNTIDGALSFSNDLVGIWGIYAQSITKPDLFNNASLENISNQTTLLSENIPLEINNKFTVQEGNNNVEYTITNVSDTVVEAVSNTGESTTFDKSFFNESKSDDISSLKDELDSFDFASEDIDVITNNNLELERIQNNITTFVESLPKTCKN